MLQVNSGLFHPWIQVLRRSAMTYSDTLSSVNFLRYNFPCYPAQCWCALKRCTCGNWAVWLLLLAAIILFNQACTPTREKLVTFSLAPAGNMGFPRPLLNKLPHMEDGSHSSPNPPEVTGTFTVGHLSLQRWNIWCHQLGESHPHLQPEGGFALQRVHEHKEIPLAAGERECSQDRLPQVVFLCLGFSHPGKKDLTWFAWRKFTAPNCEVFLFCCGCF